ncbi:hypothetical protein TIFTF001_028979 [Ficus carica]|uniref:MYB transcription factor n=1 Tax=Ficus carica TaxID=3494 RepID=A0AA88J2Q8_FICCA|nr:hypothetical protein TIFTF001_028979 [Ficus carica]
MVNKRERGELTKHHTGRIPCCEKDNVKRGQWTPEEDNKLSSYIAQHGTRNWRLIPKNAAQLPGRTDNDVKNHWITKLKKKLSGMGIDPVTHKPFSHLMAEIATTLERPQVAHLAKAAVGSFKDEMLHLLTKRRIDFQLQQSNTALGNAPATYVNSKHEEQDNDAIEKIIVGLSRAIQEPEVLWNNAGPTFANFTGNCSAFPFSVSGFPYEPSTFSNEHDGSLLNQSICTGSTCIAVDRQASLPEKLEENAEDYRATKEMRTKPIVFNSDNVLWDLPSDDLMHPVD